MSKERYSIRVIDTAVAYSPEGAELLIVFLPGFALELDLNPDLYYPVRRNTKKL